PPPALHSFPTRRSSDLRVLRKWIVMRDIVESRRKRLARSSGVESMMPALCSSRDQGALEQSLRVDDRVVAHAAEEPPKFTDFPPDRKSTRLNSSHDQIS